MISQFFIDNSPIGRFDWKSKHPITLSHYDYFDVMDKAGKLPYKLNARYGPMSINKDDIDPVCPEYNNRNHISEIYKYLYSMINSSGYYHHSFKSILKSMAMQKVHSNFHFLASSTRLKNSLDGMYDYSSIVGWVYKRLKPMYPKACRSKFPTNATGSRYNVIVSVEPGIYPIILRGLNIMIITVKKDQYEITSNSRYLTIDIDLYGKDHLKWGRVIMNDIDDFYGSFERNKKTNPCEPRITRRDFMRGSLIHETNIDISDDGVIHPSKQPVLELIDKYNKATDIFTKYKMQQRLGILLYGEQGTGKTSFVYTLAKHLEWDALFVDIASLKRLMQDSEIPRIYVLEEIDTMVNEHKTLKSRAVFQTNDDEDEEPDGSTNIIRQFLITMDLVHDGSIIIATTNHIENLDPAIIRDGRFDIKLKFENFTEDESIEMIHRFDEDVDTIRELVKDKNLEGINPAYLENVIRQKKIMDLGIKYEN